MKKLIILAFLILLTSVGCSDTAKRKLLAFPFVSMLVGEEYDPNVKILSVTAGVDGQTYGAGSQLPITIQYSGPISVENPADLCITLNNGDKVCGATINGDKVTFNYTVTENSGNIANLQVTALEGAPIISPVSSLQVNPVIPTVDGTNTLVSANNQPIAIDTTGPAVTSVSSTSSSGTYAAGSVISIAVNFSEVVLVNGVPELYLNIGDGKTVKATYVSGSGTGTLVFQYTVETAHTTAGADLNYSNIDSLVLPNGATIADAAGNKPAGGTTTQYTGSELGYVTLPPIDSNISLAGTNDIKIDGAMPSVSFGTSGTGSGTEPAEGATAAASIPITLSGPATQDITITYQILGTSTATNGVDFTGLTGTLNIAQGASSGNISFTLNGDGVYEGNETIQLQITGVTGAAMGAGTTFTYTINDAQTAPAVSFASGATANVGEDAGTYSAVVNLSTKSAFPVSFTVNTANGSATAPADYTAISSQVFTIPAGQTSVTIPVTIIDDLVYNGDQDFQIALSSLSANASFSGGGATLGQTVTITDNELPPLPTLSFTSGATASVAENVAGGNYVLSFSLSSPAPAGGVSFTVSLTNGTATAGEDFTIPGDLTVSIPAGATTGTFSIPIINDTAVEGAETFSVSIGSPTGAVLAAVTTQTVTILDDDVPTISFTGATSVAENGGSIVVGFQLSSSSTNQISFDVNTVNGTATAGSDFTAISQQVIIAAGQTTGSVTINITDDDVYEGNETFQVAVSNVTNANPPANRTITITDNETKPTLSIASASASVTEGQTHQMRVNLSGKASTDVSFTVTTANGTAIAGDDYTAINGTTFTIPATSTYVDVPVVTLTDALHENDETFTATIAGAGGFTTSGTTVQTITINDATTAPTITIAGDAPSSVGEGAGNYSFSVTLSAVSGRDTTFQVSTVNGSAIGGQDFTTQTNVTYTIPAGETSVTVNIPITDDLSAEGTENFTVQIATFSGATAGASVSKVINILDNDLGIVSATTMDTNGNGRIDTYKIVFNTTVTDSSFNAARWAIGDYTGLTFNNAATVGGETNTANDNTIYISFTEKDTPDTGAKPDVITTLLSGVGGITGTGSEVLLAYGTAGITEIDGARPVLLSAEGTSGSSTLTLVFSEPVYGGTIAACTGTTGNLQTSHLIYNNVASGGATGIGAVTDSCSEPDNTIVVSTTGALAMDDSGQDSINGLTGASGLIDGAGLNLLGPKTITVNAGIAPFIKVVELYDTNSDGSIDTLRAYFRDSGDTMNVDMNDTTLTALTQFLANGASPTGVNTGVTANDHIVNFQVGNITGTGPNVLTSFSFTRTEASSWLSMGAAQLANFSSGYTIVDKAPPVITSVTATDGANDKLTISFSEDIAEAIRTAINSGNIGAYLDLKNASGTSINFPAISSITWTANNTLEITFTGDVSATIPDGSSITLKSGGSQIMDAASNFAVSTGYMAGSFTTDVIPPYLTLVTDATPATNYSGSTGTSTILVEFSEGVKHDGGANSATLLSNFTLQLASGGAAISLASVTMVAPDIYQITTTSRLTSGTEYKLTVATGVQDLAGNNIVDPRALTFYANDALRVLAADAISTTQVRITYSRLLSASSAGCEGASACSAKYFFNPSLGSVLSATVSSNSVTLTLDGSVEMKGMAYTVVAANGDSADDPASAPSAFDTGAGDAIRDNTGTLTLSANPLDRISFLGRGAAVNTFTSGWYMDDPFADGSVFSFTFTNQGKVYVGPNTQNNTTLRFDPNGMNIVGLSFRFRNNQNVSLNCGFSVNRWGFGFETVYASNTACDGTDGAGPKYVGPLKEIGLVGFNSLSFTGGEALFVGPIKNNASEAYFTQDIGNQLNMTSFSNRSFTGGGNTESIQTFFAHANNLYMGYSSTHGQQAPIMTRLPVSFSSGTITQIDNANNQTDNLNLGSVPEIGRSSNPAGGSDAVGVDSINVYNGKMYIANNGGVRFSSDLISYAASNGSGTSSATPPFSGTTLVLPGAANSIVEGLFKVAPGQKGIPFMKSNLSGNRLYLARNVAAGSTFTTLGSGVTRNIDDPNKTQNYGELWVCNPATAGVATDCDNTADWTLLLTTNPAVNDATRLDSSKADSKAISMLEITPEGVVYVGVDSPNGYRIYRNTLSSGLIPQSGWEQQGSDGMGTCASSHGCYTHIQSSAVAQYGSTNTYYTYITVGKYNTTNLWHAPIKVYRQADVGASVIVFNEVLGKSTTLMAYIAQVSKGSKMWVLGVIGVGLILLFARRRYFAHH